MTPEAAHEYRQARRKISAERGVATRRKRRDARVANVAALIANGKNPGPRYQCAVCGRRLEDQSAIDQGIGRECLETIRQAIAARKAA
ncbi:MAG: DUF6011 domain-containing protein [Rhodomicrobium sp.]